MDTTVVQQWVSNPRANYGFIIANELASDKLVLSSSTATDPTLRPTFDVYWYLP